MNAQQQIEIVHALEHRADTSAVVHLEYEDRSVVGRVRRSPGNPGFYDLEVAGKREPIDVPRLTLAKLGHQTIIAL